MRVCLVVALLGIFALGFIAAAAEPAPPPPSADAIKKLIDQLGDDHYERRITAQQRLLEVGEAASQQLEFLKSNDPEISLRVNLILPVIQRERSMSEERAFLLERYTNVLGIRKFSRIVSEPPGESVNRGITVDSALDWLAKNQEADGHWDSVKHGAQVNADVAQTSLAVLAFLGAGHTLKVGKYKENVQKGIGWLIAQMREDGALLCDGKPVDGLSQACAGIALAESAGMARLKKEEAQKVCDFSIASFQRADGGFGAVAGGKDSDLFTTTLFTMQLKSVKVAGLTVPHESFDRLITYIDTLFDEKANAFRLAPGLKPTGRATYFGLLCRTFLGWKREDLEATVESAARLYGVPGDPDGDVLGDYLGTLVSFMSGGENWQNFNQALRSALGRTERGGDVSGSFAPEGEWTGAGRVFQTAVRSLCFEVYYRYQKMD
jgi:hypothetical protein